MPLAMLEGSRSFQLWDGSEQDLYPQGSQGAHGKDHHPRSLLLLLLLLELLWRKHPWIDGDAKKQNLKLSLSLHKTKNRFLYLALSFFSSSSSCCFFSVSVCSHSLQRVQRDDNPQASSIR
jgi:hypothetical protein